MIVAITLLQTTDLGSIIKDYGWIGVIILLFFDRVWPTLQEHFSATHKARLAREDEDRRTRAQQNERQITVLEQLGGQLHTFGLALMTIAERLNRVETTQNERFNKIEYDQDVMREALAILADRKQQQRKQAAD